MITFVDTSGLFALLDSDDLAHSRARAAFASLAERNARLVTSSYVLVETIALLQRRLGMIAVRNFETKIRPLLEIIWIDLHWHERAMQRLLTNDRRKLSLVDCVSFEVMEAKGIRSALAFDKHFEEQGYASPEPEG